MRKKSLIIYIQFSPSIKRLFLTTAFNEGYFILIKSPNS